MYSNYRKPHAYYKAALAGPGAAATPIDMMPQTLRPSSSTSLARQQQQQRQHQPLLPVASSQVAPLASQSQPTTTTSRAPTQDPARASSSTGRASTGGHSVLNVHDDDWDSDPELELAPVREAARVQRRPPPQPARSTPYYSTLVEPSLSLGEQWPRKSRDKPLRPVRGFQRIDPHIRPRKIREIPKPGPNKALYALTAHIADTFQKYNPEFQYDGEKSNPRRVLTKPSKPAKNDGFDNEDYDYILRVGDVLGEEKDHQYRVIDLLGQGTFGQVVKCERVGSGELYSVKVIKNKPAYRTQSRMEIEILKKLNSALNEQDRQHILQLQHTFTHKNHLCLVFELLSFNLYELIKQNGFKGLSLNLVRVFALQLLDTLALLKESKIIHCDLKPENILLRSVDSPSIKVIDFGSACHEANRIYSYIQSRFYRSPEVLMGIPYTGAIDMWSLGCIVAELFIGIPLFPGSSEYNQLRRIVDMLGYPPPDMLERGKTSANFFVKEIQPNGKPSYRMKTREQYSKDAHKTEMPSKQYFSQSTLPAIIMKCNTSTRSAAMMDEQERKHDMQMRKALVDFLQGVLELNPLKRWTPKQARYHPFITGEPFTEPYQPEKHMKNAIKKLQQNAAVPRPVMQPTNGTARQPAEGADAVRSLEAAATIATARQAALNTAASVVHMSKPGEGHDSATPNRQRQQQQQQQQQRARAQSVNAPTAPSQIQELVHDLHAQQLSHGTGATENGTHNTNGRKVRPSQLADELASQEGQRRYHRHARSYGNLVGIFPSDLAPPSSAFDMSGNAQNGDTNGTSETSSLEKHTVFDERPSNAAGAATLPSTSSSSRKVKIAPMLKVRYGSRDSFRMPDEVHRSTYRGGDALALASGTQSGFVLTNDDDWFTEPSSSSSTTSRPKGRLSHAGEAAGGLFMMRQEKGGSEFSAAPTSSASTHSNSGGGKRVAAAFRRRVAGQ
ncbi:kinase-like domain-containing protein [Syncephalastrum racemosum]|uniref:Kinase-like domain-containing protein n=1 Tax=Syncephalastrum racemosum TaxID=13706 RepID=A0A1X2H1K2_SYNRA|nr:kinase-like domain-containing protein [Syncephalastrum racemosum]